MGAGYRNPLAGIGFAVGALSMVGFPMLSGFISKLLFATSALQSPHKMLPTIIALAISTILNAVYFLRLVITLYTIPSEMPEEETEQLAGEPEVLLVSARSLKKTWEEGQESFGARVRRLSLEERGEWPKSPGFGKFHLAVVSFILLNLVLGLFSQPIVAAIGSGLGMFA